MLLHNIDAGLVLSFKQTLCKSLKIRWHRCETFSSLSSLPVPQEDELLTWQKDVCKGLGLSWPRPKAKAGKPNRQALWLRVIYAEVRAGRTLPDGVTAAVPAWLSGDSLASTGVSDAEVGAAGELAKCEAVAKKRRRTTIDLDVKDWFLDYHECMKVKHKWNMRQSGRREVGNQMKISHDW